MATTVVRILLLVTILAMALLAFLYLRQRRMAWSEFCAWGLLALVLPLLGPFLVFVFRPGEFRDKKVRPGATRKADGAAKGEKGPAERVISS